MTATVMVILSQVPVSNIRDDYYGVFGAMTGTDVQYVSLSPYGLATNMRFKNLFWLINADHSYDSFLLGSSKAEYIPVDSFGPNWFNFYLGGGVPIDYLRSMRVLGQHLDVRHVVIALDQFSFFKQRDATLPTLRPYPESWVDWPSFIGGYLFRVSTPSFVQERRDSTKYRRLKVTPGQVTPQLETLVARRRARRDLDLLAVGPDGSAKPLAFATPSLDERFAEIEEMIRLSQEHGFRLTFLITPVHYKNLLALDMDIMYAYKKRLAQLTEFYDFTGLTESTLGNEYWYDLTHFKEEIGLRIVRVLKNGPTSDFGRIVTVENVDVYHRRMVDEIQEAIPRLARIDRNVWIHPTLTDTIR